MQENNKSSVIENSYEQEISSQDRFKEKLYIANKNFNEQEQRIENERKIDSIEKGNEEEESVLSDLELDKVDSKFY